MSVDTMNVTVGVAAGVLVAGETGVPDRKSVTIVNNGSATIYIGKAGVTVAAGSNLGGLPLAPGASLTLDRAPQGDIYAISGTAGQDVRVLTEEGS